MVEVEAIKVVIKVEEVTMRVEHEFGVLGGNGELKTSFEFLSSANVEDIAVLVFPRVGEMSHKIADAGWICRASASRGKDFNSGKTDGVQRVRNKNIMCLRLKKIFRIDRVTGKAMKVVLSKMDKKSLDRRERHS
jgi:hypothetical protein